MRGARGTTRVVWTPERIQEAIEAWDAAGSSDQAALTLSSRWGVHVTGSLVRAAASRAKELGTQLPPVAKAPVPPEPPPEPPPEARPLPPAPPPLDLGEPTLIAVIADLHTPDHDEGCLQAFERWAQYAKPNEIIVAGDFMEMESASQHAGTRPRLVEDDIAAGVKVARRLLELCPRVTVRLGNHDGARFAHMVHNRVPTLASRMMDPMTEIAALGVQIDARRHAPTRRGRLLVIHGDEMIRGRFAPMFSTKKAVEVYGEAGTVIVFGHVHKEQSFVRPMEQGNCEAHALSCMRTLEPEWLGPETSGWTQGWACCYQAKDRRPTLDRIRYESGAAYWGGKRF